MATTTYLGVTKLEVGQAQKEATINEAFDAFDAALGSALIQGLKLEWVSASSIKVKTGSAALPNGTHVRAAADITVSSISLGNNTWGHVYLYKSAGVAAVEVVTTAPAPYFGAAYQKTSDATRRYLGSVRTNGSGNIYKFRHEGNVIYYLEDVSASPFRCLNGGTATSETNVDLTAVVPGTSVAALITAINTSTNAVMLVGNADDVSSNGLLQIAAEQRFPEKHPLTSAQTLNYKFDTAPSGGSGYIDIRGFEVNR